MLAKVMLDRCTKISIGLSLALSAGFAIAAPQISTLQVNNKYCSATADAQYQACQNEARDDFHRTRAICINTVNASARAECFDEAEDAEEEANTLCGTQRMARRNLCGMLGEQRYEPNFTPGLFDRDFTRLTKPNPYFPLRIGNQWEYEGGDETIRIEVLNKTKLIEGVTCIVVRDLVEVDGQPVEDTDDWFGQRLNGAVDYCGENVKDYETFAGDNPAEAELVDIAGSFKHGRDGAKAGTQFLATPQVGNVYRQEWAPGEAEDAAKIASVNYFYGSNATLDRYAPRLLVDRMCSSKKCVVIREFSPKEPDNFQYKYYAPGIGLFLDINPNTVSIKQLVACNFDARCVGLPLP